MDLGIRGRTAIIAGGSAGMGRATAFALAREGVDLVLAARGEARLKAVAAQIADETGVKATSVACDHATAEGRAALLAACPAPDILVITLSPPPTTEDYRAITETDWAQAFASAMVGPVELMKAAIPGMAQRRFGRIVNIATIAAKFPIELRLLSGAPRSALLNYTAAISRKVARDNVIINNLLPGMYRTERVGERLDQMAQEQGISVEAAEAAFAKRWRIATRTLGDPEDIGAFAAMFCSAYAGFTVGQNVVFDGGATPGIF